MKDWGRDQVARHLFELMNRDRRWVSSPDSVWEFYVDHGWHQGYLRIADEIIKKGFKP